MSVFYSVMERTQTIPSSSDDKKAKQVAAQRSCNINLDRASMSSVVVNAPFQMVPSQVRKVRYERRDKDATFSVDKSENLS